jgi:hypothetical protein
MRRLLSTGVAAVVLSAALAGCSTGSPEATLAADSNDVVSAANSGDAAALRTAAGRMLEEIRKQNDAGDLTTAKASTLQVLLNRIIANAGDLEPSASPSPSPSESPSPSPSPSPESPSPSPSESPSPEPPSPSPSPSPASVPSVLSPQPLAPQADHASARPSPSS